MAIAVFLVADRDRSPVDAARALVDDDAGFDTGLEAGQTLAKVAQHLERAVDECRAAERGVACQALAGALGYAEVLASVVLHCTAPDRHEARTKMAVYLDDVVDTGVDAARVPVPPRLPSCED